MAKITKQIRSSREFRRLIDFIRAKYIMQGKKPPTTSQITEIIAKKTDMEELLKDVFIRF